MSKSETRGTAAAEAEAETRWRDRIGGSPAALDIVGWQERSVLGSRDLGVGLGWKGIGSQGSLDLG